MELRTRYATTSDGVNIAYATVGEGPMHGTQQYSWWRRRGVHLSGSKLAGAYLIAQSST